MCLLFRTGDVKIMQELSTRHPRPELKRTTPLFIAAQHNQLEMVEFLLQQEKEENKRRRKTGEREENKRTCDMNGVTPLLIAIKEGNLEIVDMLLVEALVQEISSQGAKRVKERCQKTEWGKKMYTMACEAIRDDEDGNDRKMRESTESQTLRAPNIDEKDNEDRNVLHYTFMSRKPEEMTMKIKDFIQATCESSDQKLMDLLTAKDLNEDTPLHQLAEQTFDLEVFRKIFTDMTEAGLRVLECFWKNSRRQSPLHVAAANPMNSAFVQATLDLDEDKIEQLLFEKDEYSNTPLHLATRSKRVDIPPLLKFVKEKTKEPVRYLTTKNIKGWTPFSCAVAIGSIDMVRYMGQGLNFDERKMLVNQADSKNTSPLHVAAKYGHVDVFNLLLEHGADIKRLGPDQHTPLEVAIERDQRGIIRNIIEGPHWETAFQTPTASKSSELDTPLRNLIRRFPDLAEEFLDKCCTVEKVDNQEEVIDMKYDFIEDTHSYAKFGKEKDDSETMFCLKDEVKEIQKRDENHPFVALAKQRHVKLDRLEDPYEVPIINHPLMIMAKERRVDLLQHPLCLAITLKKWNKYGRDLYFFQLAFYIVFLTALNVFILTSDSPLDNPEDFKHCSGQFFGETVNVAEELGSSVQLSCSMTNSTSGMPLECSGMFFNYSANIEEPEPENRFPWVPEVNAISRYVLLVMNVLRVIFFFVNKEYKAVLNQLKTFHWKNPTLPTVFLFDALVYSLAIVVTTHNFVLPPSCYHFQVCAVTITLAWMNLLLNMRLLYGIGKYIILFQDVIYTFLAVSIVFVIMITGFAFSFHLLLSTREEFRYPHDAMMKTFLMMSGIIS